MRKFASPGGGKEDKEIKKNRCVNFIVEIYPIQKYSKYALKFKI
jgi:hypothetical protein